LTVDAIDATARMTCCELHTTAKTAKRARG
jgi:hypothetical protein